MIKKIISCILVVVFFNFVFAQTNVMVEPPSFTRMISNWIEMQPTANYTLLKKNNPFWSPNDVYLLTPTFMGRLLQENDQLKTNELILRDQVGQYVSRISNRDAQYKVVNDLYLIGVSRIENLTNQINLMTQYIGIQDTQIAKLYTREKWGALGDILLFVGGLVIGALVTYGMFSVVAATIK